MSAALLFVVVLQDLVQDLTPSENYLEVIFGCKGTKLLSVDHNQDLR